MSTQEKRKNDPPLGLMFLEDWMKEKKCSSVKLGELLGKDPQIIYAWRHGRSLPGLCEVLMIQIITGIQPDSWLSAEKRKRLNAVESPF